MAKLTQTQVKEKADEWGQKQKEIERLQAKYDAAIRPDADRQAIELNDLLARHADELAPIAKRHEPKLEKFQAEAAAIEAEVKGWLEGNGKPVTLAGEIAEAGLKIGTKIGNRIVDKEKLVQLCKTKAVDVWACVDVVLKKAEKLLGAKEVDEISTKAEIPTKNVYLKLKD